MKYVLAGLIGVIVAGLVGVGAILYVRATAPRKTRPRADRDGDRPEGDDLRRVAAARRLRSSPASRGP